MDYSINFVGTIDWLAIWKKLMNLFVAEYTVILDVSNIAFIFEIEIQVQNA